MKRGFITRAVLAALFVTSVPSAPADAAIVCPPVDAALTRSPVPTRSEIPELYRNDADGFTTITAFLADPADANRPVMLPASSLAPSPPVADTDYGVWFHTWSAAPNITTIGVWATRQDRKVRLPVAAVENVGSDLGSIQSYLTGRGLIAALHHAFNTAPFLWNMLLVGPDGTAYIPVAGGLVYGLGVVIASYFLTLYPAPIGWDNWEPIYVWTLYQNGSGVQEWGGTAVRESAAYEFGFDQDASGYGGHGCKRTRIDLVERNATKTTAHAGVWIIQDSTGRCDGLCLGGTGKKSTFDARERFTAGIQAEGIDVPLVVVEQTEHKEGTQPFLLYPDYQKEELKIGVEANGSFVPLIGARFEAWHAAPPQRQRRLISFGAFDPLGTYHPVIGTRMTFERQTSDVWLFLLALDGVGSRQTGDAMIDLGTFDPGENFVPLIGTKYDDDFTGHRFEYRAMISTGPYAGNQWEPVLAITYDGEQTLTSWAVADANNDYARMGQWFVAAGAYNPAIGYKPLAGAHFEKGQGDGVVERYQVGVFPGDYSMYVPLAEARWSSTLTSGYWIAEFANRGTHAPANARVDAGAVTPVTGFTPVAGAQISAGKPDRYGVGVWALNQFVPVVEACYAPPLNIPMGRDPVAGVVPVPGVPSPQNGSVGVAASGGEARIPLLWVGSQDGKPAYGATQDCPA